MPVNLSIKEVPDAMADRLRARAERNHRSLQGELMAIIEQAVTQESEMRAQSQRHSAVWGVGEPRGKKTIEQIAAEHRLLYPKPFTGLPLAVDIVREDRDSR